MGDTRLGSVFTSRGGVDDELFGSLDDHLLLNILEKLEAREDQQAWCLACKRFLAVEASSRKKLKLRKVEALENALRRYRDIEELDFSACLQTDDITLETVGKLSGRYLRALNLSPIEDIHLKTVEKLLERDLRSRDHKRLNLALAQSSRFSETGLLSLVKLWFQLRHLDLSYCSSHIADRGIIAVAQLTKLQSLKLVNCRNITDAGLGCVAAGCKNLRSLSLKWCLGVSDTGISWIATNCKQLETLDLSYTEVSMVGLASISGMQSLKNLYLVSCKGVDDTGLAFLEKNCKSSVKLVDVTGCKSISDRGIMALATGPVSLQQLCLSNCPLITDRLLARFEKFRSLKVIRLDGCHNVAGGLAFIGQYCKNLGKFTVRSCRGVTDAKICAVAQGCRDLRDINLTCCCDLTDLAVASIVASCRSLRSIKLKDCNLITDKGFALLGNNCTALEVVNLSYCNIHDEGLKSFARCTSLRTLKLANCVNITDEGILHIAASCLGLRKVDLYASNGVGDAGIDAFHTRCLLRV